MDLKYIFQRMLHMDYAAMLKQINGIHKKTGMGRIKIFLDMKDCAVKYGAGYMDYALFEMYNMTDAQRDTYVTRGRNNAFVKKYNDPNYIHLFAQKDAFNQLFDAYLKRDWLAVTKDNRAEVMAFLERHSTFMAKPVEGACGRGVERLNTADFGSVQACCEHIFSLGVPYVLEEVISQHAQLNAIYPHAINTVRVVTLNENGKIRLVCACFRIGNHGKHVDNFHNGGILAPVDVNSGLITANAVDHNKNVYQVHPMTNAPIKDFQIPYWEQIAQMVTRAAEVVPQVAYVGWDVAVTPDGPCLVEGNEFPAYDLYQLPEHTPDKIGMMVKFNEK